MRKYSIKRDLAFYKGYLLGHKNALLLISGELHKQIDYLEKKVKELEKEVENNDTNH